MTFCFLIGNAGLGKEAILQLAKHNPSRIYICARTESKAHKAIDDIRSVVGSAVDIRLIKLDLSSLKSVRGAAEKFLSDCDRLDTLILNAGVMCLPPDITEDGYEIQFATNHMGHFYLVKLLLPTLLKTAKFPPNDVRVIAVSSLAQVLAPLNLSDMFSTSTLCELPTWNRYGASKAANILFTAELARRHPEITSVSIHPGVIHTGLWQASKASNPVMRYGLAAFNPLLTSEKEGTLNHLWTAGTEKGNLTNGEYYIPVGVRGWGNWFAHDKEFSKSLWEWTEQQLGF